MTPLLLPLVALTLLGADAPVSRDVLLGETRVYRVRQTAKVDQIPAGAKSVRFWVAVPDDTRQQEVLDLSVVSAPGPWRFEHEPDRGNRFLYVEISDPKTSEIEVVVEFVVRRQPVLFEVQPEKVGEITSVHRRIHAEDLEYDAPHMQVTPAILALANETCGKDRNPATQARKLLDLVAQKADHYSKDPSKPKCGIGDAADCLTNGGGCCTDLHSLFIALARARGIPSRMQMGYRLLEKNEGKEVDPGYRCWVEYFLPGYGWMPADIVEADAADGEGPARWYSGLTERRVWLNSGREFVLNPRQALDHVNTMIIGYAEIDGRPARVLPEGELPAQLSRKILFTEIRGAGPTWLGAAEPPRTRPGEPKSASGTR
jgi:transglutaminase-like putative cysteine protease